MYSLAASTASRVPHPEEVYEWKYVSMQALNRDVSMRPEAYTEWFKIALNEIQSKKLAVAT